MQNVSQSQVRYFQVKTNKNDRREKSPYNKQGGKFNDRMSYLSYRCYDKTETSAGQFPSNCM